MTKPKRPRGRPTSPDPLSVQVHIRMRPDQTAKLKTLGGPPWVREQIDRADLPGAKPREKTK